MTIEKEATYHDMPTEKEFGYAQAIKVGDTIYLSGQVSVNPDDQNNIVGVGNMEAQMRQGYTNIPNSPYWKIRATNFGLTSRIRALGGKSQSN